MKVLGKLIVVELKLFLREPMTVVFSLALPLIMLLILGGVFGNEADAGVYRGIGPMTYYVPAYVALVTASIGLISVPVHVAEMRDRGVLRRFQASGLPVWAFAGAQVCVGVVIAAVSSIVLVAAAVPIYDFPGPDSILLVLGAFVLSAVMFGAFGVMLGAILPTARAAQALGIMLWFVMLLLGGPGPPPEVLSDAMGAISEVLPLTHAVAIVQRGWISTDPGLSLLVVIGILVGTAGVTLRFFRWE
jgi:ABC-2 type transport system permease protein